MAKMTGPDLMALGVEAADDYVGDGVALNEAVTKLAHREDLSADEVRRVAEFANQAAYSQLWKTAGSTKTIEFPRADASEILEGLNSAHLPDDRGITFHKSARLKGSALDPDSELRKAARARVEAFKFEGTPQQRLEHLKLAGEKVVERFEEELFAKRQTKLAYEEECCEAFRQMMLERYYDEGGPGTRLGHEALIKCASEIVAAVKTLKPHHLKRAARLVYVAGKSIEPTFEIEPAALAGLLKSAAAAEPHRIAGFLSTPDSPVLVINGSHKVFLMLDTLSDVDKDINAVTSGMIQADDGMRAVNKKLESNFSMGPDELIAPDDEKAYAVRKARETSGEPAGKYQASVG